VTDLASADWYLGDDVHQSLAELRRTDPVHWQEMDGEPGCWFVLRHADVVHVSRHPELFSSWLKGILLEDPDEVALEGARQMLLIMDPPQHSAYRQPLAPHFSARVIGAMEEGLRNRARMLLRDAAEKGEVDLSHDVAAPLASESIAVLMGLPFEDTPQLRVWAEVNLGGQDDEVVASYEGNAAADMIAYAMAWAATRRAQPGGDDVTSLLLETTFDGRPMSDLEFGSFFLQLVTAGNDTTRTLISTGVVELLDHPDQLAALRADRSLVPTAVEEILRWCNPVHAMRRTAAVDTEIGGQAIAQGDKVAIHFTSANRDEAAFTDAATFDIRRSPNPHLTFGIGTHFCLGAHVARLSARIFLEEALDAWPSIELAGEPTRIRSNLTNGHRRVPVRLGRGGH
jgi:cytochrome P450